MELLFLIICIEAYYYTRTRDRQALVGISLVIVLAFIVLIFYFSIPSISPYFNFNSAPPLQIIITVIITALGSALILGVFYKAAITFVLIIDDEIQKRKSKDGSIFSLSRNNILFWCTLLILYQLIVK